MKNMILLTGAAGFIGSCFLTELIKEGEKVIIVDDFQIEKKWRNFKEKAFYQQVERSDLFGYLEREKPPISCVLHLGARTDTTEFDNAIFEELNLDYSKKLWDYCTTQQIPMIYASSAATYGGGAWGFEDNHKIVPALKPLNPYGRSKNDFDKWVLNQDQTPPYWAGLKFFNVYGPNEYHKGRMASIVWHAYHQIKETGKVKLFRSHKESCADGEQRRDFIYVKDVLQTGLFLMRHNQTSGLYNIGTGKAVSYNELVTSIFDALKLPTNIEYIDIPQDIRNTYQYFTEANIQKLRSVQYKKVFYSIQDGVKDYVSLFLINQKHY